MKSLFTVLFTFMFVIAVSGQSLGIETLWEKTGLSYNAGDACRGIAYAKIGDAKHLYLASRTHSMNRVVVVDAATGDSINTLSNTGISGGTHVVSTLAITADNVLLVTNLTVDARLKSEGNNPYKVYAYTSETAEPQLVIEYNTPADDEKASRFGDKIIVTGNYADGSAKLYVSNWFIQPGGVEVTIFSMMADPDNANTYKFNPVPVKKYFTIEGFNSGDAKNFASYLERPDGSFLWTSNGAPIYNFDKNGNLVNQSPEIAPNFIAKNTNGLKYLGSDGVYEYIAFVNYSTDGAVSGFTEIYKYPIGDFVKGGRAYIVARTNAIDFSEASVSNGNGAGDITVDLSGEYPVLYTLQTNQLIGAYTVKSVSLADYAPDNSENTQIIWERNDRKNGVPDYFGRLHATPEFPESSYSSPEYISQDIAFGTVGGERTLYSLITKGPEIHTINPDDGEDIGVLTLPEQSLLAEGSVGIWSMTVTEDGKLLVANKAAANGKFNVYMYDSNSAQPQLALSYPVPSDIPLELGGSKVDVIGSYAEGTAKLYVATTQASWGVEDEIKKVYVFSMRADGESFVFDVTPAIIEFNPGAIASTGAWSFHNPTVAAKTDYTFYWMATYYPVMHFDLNGNLLGKGDENILIPRGNAPKYMGKDADKNEYMAYYAYRESNNSTPAGRAEVYTYPENNLSGEGTAIFARTTSMGKFVEAPSNIQADGSVAVERTSDDVILYVMSSNQGLGAYKLDLALTIRDDVAINSAMPISLNVCQRGDKIVVSGAGVQSVDLISLTGQTVKRENNSAEINVSGLKGAYLLKVKTVLGDTKVIKQIVQ
ncbi:MAG: hypothetical protein LBH32_10390 [Dysgonamonadaceae bacterium]|jgi:hypothetical protein|nr:hypothetical protein [Dysgonamonadaceae bacterium]